MDIAITKMSSKGQIVIPLEMRDDIQEGEKLVLVKHMNQLILSKVETLSKNFKEDIEFAKRTEKALDRISRGKGIEMDFDEFIEEMDKW